MLIMKLPVTLTDENWVAYVHSANYTKMMAWQQQAVIR